MEMNLNKWKLIDALNCKYVVENPGRGEFVVKGHIEGGGAQKIGLAFYRENQKLALTMNTWFPLIPQRSRRCSKFTRKPEASMRSCETSGPPKRRSAATSHRQAKQ